MYDLLTYYAEIEEDLTKANEYYARMKEAYPEEDLTKFAGIDLGENLGDIKKGSVTETKQIPKEYNLSNAYPNPFNPTTKIRYSIPQDGFVKIIVYDILGREVVTLVNEYKPAGEYEVEFTAKGLSSGMYFYKIESGNFMAVKKMLLVK